MLVQFQCLDSKTYDRLKSCTRNLTLKSICPISLNSTGLYFEQKWCEPTTMTINCGTGFLINIICSFYGIDPNLKCDSGFYSGSPTVCYSDSFSQVNSTCSGYQNCSINGNPSFKKYILNACDGYTSTLFVKWECVRQIIIDNNQAITMNTENNNEYCLNDDSLLLLGNCSKISRYEPEFLTSTSLSNFDYPIFEKIICSGGKSVIKCLNSHIIRIFSAYYGIQMKTQTNCIQQSANEVPTKCYYPSVYIKVSQICEFQNECEIKATSSFFNNTDICPTSKQFIVQYQCVKNYALRNAITKLGKCFKNNEIPLICPEHIQKDSQIHQNTYCSINDGSVNLNCQQNQTIEVICSFYGQHPSIKECTIQKETPVCYFDSVFKTIKKTCNGIQSCSIQLSSLQSCIGLKIFHIKWKCI